MHPEAFTIPFVGFTVHWYGIMMATAFLVLVGNMIWLSRKAGKPVSMMSDLGCWIMVSGIVGARIAHVVANWAHFSVAPWWGVFAVWQGGLVYQGGFIGAAAGIWLFAYYHKEGSLYYYDLVSTSLPVAHALGRIGCFINGCCYGQRCEGPVGAQFPHNSAAGWEQYHAGLVENGHVNGLFTSVVNHDLGPGEMQARLEGLVEQGLVLPEQARALPVHPVQLYEATIETIIFVILVLYFKKRKLKGTVACLYMMLYGCARILLEFFRGDDRTMLGPISLGQTLSVVMIGAGIIAWSILSVRERKKAQSTA